MSRTPEKESLKYALQEDVRFFVSDKEIRLRKGIWNYEEGCLPLEEYGADYVKCLKEVFELLDTRGFSMNELDAYLLEPYEREQAETMLQQLIEAGFVISHDEKTLHQRITKAITGGLELFEEDLDVSSGDVKPLIFCTDEEYVRQKWQDMAPRFKVESRFLSEEQMAALRKSDLTTCIDALTTIEETAKMSEWIKGAAAVVICMSELSVTFMRNVNRLSIKEKIPVILSFIDGPTITLLASTPYKTGCLECFERRAMARMEDHVQYIRFVEGMKGKEAKANKDHSCQIMLLDLLANLSFTEGYMFVRVGASRFSGRLLSIYLPTLEIQMQNILRVPFCEACGFVANAQFDELNISSRRIIDDFSSRVFGKE